MTTETRTFHIGIPVEPRAAVDADGREYWDFEISNEERDSHRTIFRMAGARIDEFNADPVVSYGHPDFNSTDPDDIIGIGPVRIEGTRMVARFYPESGDDNPKAKKVVSKLKQGLIRSASIVAVINNKHMGKRSAGEDPSTLYFSDWDLLMWGIVMKGSNPKAKMRTVSRVQELMDEEITRENHTTEQETRQRQMVLLSELQSAISAARYSRLGLRP